ncbi:MAG TPA: LysR substrate-binding domain-containing protein [Caulobacteraceae bacterium]|jgi:DNA-binding transcriptional LysR family regulator
MSARRLPSLSGLRAFEAFARTGAMTAAAAELGVTHGAVSRSVRGLEAELGARLVAGPRHRLQLTDAGRRLAAAAGAAFAQIADALPGAAPTRELVVSCYGTFAMKWLIPRLPSFLERDPSVSVRIVEEEGPADFGRGGLHAAIRLEHSAPPGARKTAFLPHHHGPVLSPALWERCGRDPRRLLAATRLCSETFLPAWTEWAARAGAELPAGVTERVFEHNTYMLEAAAAGLGVAVAPWAFAGADVLAGRLVAPLGFEAVPGRFVYLRPGVGEHPLAAAFGEWLRRQGREAPTAPAAVSLRGL